MLYRGVGADFERPRKYFRLTMNCKLGIMKCGEKWFPEKLRKNCDLENVQSESFSIRTYFTSEGKPILGNKPSNRAVKIGKRPSEMFGTILKCLQSYPKTFEIC